MRYRLANRQTLLYVVSIRNLKQELYEDSQLTISTI